MPIMIGQRSCFTSLIRLIDVGVEYCVFDVQKLSSTLDASPLNIISDRISDNNIPSQIEILNIIIP